MVTANTSYPLHQMDLVYNDGTEVSVVICDTEGNPDPRQLVVNQSQRVAGQMATGGVGYSDYEFPYRPIQQNSWEEGRGHLKIEDAGAGFYDSKNMDSMIQGHLFLAGQRRYSTGVRDVTQQIPATHTSFTDMYDARMAIQIPFTASFTGTITEVWLIGTRYGNPGTCKVALHADSGSGYAGNEQVFGTLFEDDVAEPLTSEVLVVSMEEGYAVTSGTQYWIVVSVDTDSDSANYWRFYWTYDTTGSLVSADPTDLSSYSTLGLQYYYRVTAEEWPFKAKFFRYRGATYAITSYDTSANSLDDSGDPDADTATNYKEVKLFINGDQGVVSSANRWSIADSTKTWTPGEFKGALVQFEDGQASRVPKRWRTIVDNTATTLLLDQALEVVPNPDAEATIYTILGADSWTELALGDEGYGPRDRCTDVLVTHMCVYLAFGDNYPVLRMRRYRNKSDVWTTEWQEEKQGFTFIEEAPNSYGSNVVWGAKQAFPPRVVYAEPQWANWENTVDQLTWNTGGRINSNSSCEDTGSWSALGSPTSQARSNKGSGWQGKYSWKVVTDADGEGSQQDVTVEANATYNLVCVVWIDTLPEDGKVVMAVDSTTIDSTPLNATSSSIGGSWFRLKGHYTSSGAGTVTLKIYLDGGAGKFYFDEFEMVKIPQYLEDLSSDNITNLIRYGEPERLYVLTEGGIYRENLGFFQRVPLDEYQNAQDSRNGRVAFTYDVNLLVSFLDGIQSYYRESLTNVGPDRGEGMPEGRRGNVSSGVGTAGRYFISLNGEDGYSSILANNGMGWHEIYRGPRGKEISGLFIQPIPGPQPSRLWFSEGEDLAYVYIQENPLKELQ